MHLPPPPISGAEAPEPKALESAGVARSFGIVGAFARDVRQDFAAWMHRKFQGRGCPVALESWLSVFVPNLPGKSYVRSDPLVFPTGL